MFSKNALLAGSTIAKTATLAKTARLDAYALPAAKPASAKSIPARPAAPKTKVAKTVLINPKASTPFKTATFAVKAAVPALAKAPTGTARLAGFAAAAVAAPVAPAAPAPAGQKKVGDGLQSYERTIERDDPNSNDSDAGRVRDAKAAISANAALEQQALAKLSPEDRAKYNRVAAQLASKPEARLVLQNWLTQNTLGKGGTVPASCRQLIAESRPPLVGGPKAAGGGDLLTQLDRLAGQPVAPGVDQAQLLSEVVRETANPACINQMGKGTCVATSVSIKLNLANPAEYVRLISGLASPQGSVKLANGDTIRREGDWNDTTGRSQSVRLLQPALMDYGNQGEYNNTKDKSTWWGLGSSGGTASWGRDKMLEGLFDKTFDTVEVLPWERDVIFDRVAKQANSGSPVSVAVKWQDGGHAILVTGVRDGRVYFTNPWGQKESVSVADFKRHLSSAAFDKTGGVFDDLNGARAVGAGLRNILDGAHDFNVIKVAGGVVQAAGGFVGGLVSAGGRYAEQGGQKAIDWGKAKWNKGGVGNKIVGGLAVVGGGIAKGVGFVVKNVGNAVAWAANKVGGAVAWVGDKIWSGAKAVGRAVAGAAKAVGGAVAGAAKAVGNGIKKIFSGW